MKDWQKLFPTKEAFIIFQLYIILFIFQGVFITASKTENGVYDYNTTLVVFLAELLKLIVSASLYTYKQERYSINPLEKMALRRSQLSLNRVLTIRASEKIESVRRNLTRNKPNIFNAIVINYKLLLLYFIPSLLYSIYNNLAFINLSHYDPTSYYVLLQFRVVLTAILFQCLFQKKLTVIQWISLCILTVGCMVKNFDAALIQSGSSSPGDVNIWSQIFNIYFVSIHVQNFCSCLAGTYNEYLLKTKGSTVDIFLQNVFMYLDSLVCNFFVLMWKGELGTIVNDFQSLGDVFVILITVNSAIVGIVTSFFLKNLNSILKTYASALELVMTAVVCYILFNIVITWCTIFSIGLVIIAVAMYFKNPVSNTTPLTSRDAKDRKPLMEESV